MSTQWYVQRANGERLGPVDTQQLATLVIEKRVEIDAQVGASGGAQWTALNAVPEIVHALAAQAPRHAYAPAPVPAPVPTPAPTPTPTPDADDADAPPKPEEASTVATIVILLVLLVVLARGAWLTHAIFSTP